MTKPILYSYWRSSCSWRVRAALAFKGIDYDYRGVSLIKNGGEQLTADYALINPAQMVPSFVFNGQILTESLAIMEFLEEKYPTPALLPADPISRAKVRALSLSIVAGIQPLQNLCVLNYVGVTKLDWAQHFIKTGFIALEKLLKQTSGKYSFGDQVTFADCCLVPQVYNAVRNNVDMTEFPVIKRINDELMNLAAFKTTHPSHVPDTPENERSA